MSLGTLISRTAAISAALALALMLTFSSVTLSQAQVSSSDDPAISESCHGGGHRGGCGW